MGTAFIREDQIKRVIRRLPFYVFCAPVAATELLSWFYIKVAGRDWYLSGFRLATAVIGSAGLRLYRAPIKRRVFRYPARCIAWLMCTAGLAWFIIGGGWFTLLLIPYLRQGKRLQAAPLEPPEPEWARRRLLFRLDPLDYVSLAIVSILAVLLWLGHSKVVPMAPDGYYHALVARRIVQDGRIPLWDWWEYAPLGRPHLYPPLVHVLIALFSLPFNKDIVAGIRVLSVVLPSATFLSTWYLARWLFDSRRGLLAMLIVGIDFMFALLAWFGLPSILANALVPLLLVFFLSKRLWPAAITAGLALYAHMGVSSLALLGLLMFALWHRAYLPLFIRTAGLAILFAAPWYGHIWVNRGWLGHPMRDMVPFWMAVLFKPLSLLFLNLVIVLLVIRARKLIPWAETRYRLLLCQVAGFLPMLIEYGGRYFIHTIQIWAVFAAVPLVRFLSPPVRRRTIALFMLMAVAPTLLLKGPDKGRLLRIMPMMSGWSTPLILLVSKEQHISLRDNPNQPSYIEAQELGDYIRSTTTPEQIIHTFGDLQLAIMLAFHADRPVDSAAWPEVRQPNTFSKLEEYALRDRTGCYVSTHKKMIPEDATVLQIGKFFVGIRQMEKASVP